MRSATGSRHISDMIHDRSTFQSCERMALVGGPGRRSGVIVAGQFRDVHTARDRPWRNTSDNIRASASGPSIRTAVPPATIVVPPAGDPSISSEANSAMPIRILSPPRPSTKFTRRSPIAKSFLSSRFGPSAPSLPFSRTMASPVGAVLRRRNRQSGPRRPICQNKGGRGA